MHCIFKSNANNLCKLYENGLVILWSVCVHAKKIYIIVRVFGLKTN